MKAELVLKEKMHFAVQVGGFEVHMDATPPFGAAQYPSPKQLLISSMAGCSAMDVVSLLKKHKQNFTSYKMEVEGQVATTHPQIFTEATLSYFVEGEVAAEKLNEAIHLSLSKYCSVNAMLSKVVALKWKAFINGNPVGEGKAEFNF